MICAKSIQIAILNGNANNNVFRIQWEGNVKNKVPFMIFVQVLFVKLFMSRALYNLIFEKLYNG